MPELPPSNDIVQVETMKNTKAVEFSEEKLKEIREKDDGGDQAVVEYILAEMSKEKDGGVKREHYISREKFELTEAEEIKESKDISKGRRLEDEYLKVKGKANEETTIYPELYAGIPENIFDELNTDKGYWQHVHLKYPNVLVFVPRDRSIQG